MKYGGQTGTRDGTELAVDILPGPDGSEPSELFLFNDRLLFAAKHPDVGKELWSLDLAVGDLQLLGDLKVGFEARAGLRPTDFHRHQNDFYFVLNDGIHGEELWWTDGSRDSARMLKDINPGANGSIFGKSLTSWNDRVYFMANDGVHGFELWSTDGSADGTRLEIDITAGPEGTSPNILVGWDDGVLLATADRVYSWNGFELVYWFQRAQLRGELKDFRRRDNNESILMLGRSLYRGTNDANPVFKQIQYRFETGSDFVRDEPILLPDASGAIVDVSAGLFYYDFDSSTATLLTEKETLHQAVGGEHVFVFEKVPGETTRHRLLAWKIGEWEKQELREVQQVFGGVSALGRYFVWWRLSPESALHLVEIDEQFQVTELPLPTAGTADVFPLADQILFVATSLETDRISLNAEERPPAKDSLEADEDFVDELFTAVYQTPPSDELFKGLDVNDDDLVDERDVDYVFESVIGTDRADISLNGIVDFADFLLLSSNFGQREAKRSNGDVTGDGIIDFADFLLLSNAFGNGNENV